MPTYRVQVWFSQSHDERFHRWLTIWAGRDLVRAQQVLYGNQELYPLDEWRVTVH
jgi:hypothetical protein